MKFFQTVLVALWAGISGMAYGCSVAGSYPDPGCTPGSSYTVDRDMVCEPGYSRGVRHVTEEERRDVFREYGIPWEDHGEYELDHFIPLELGGDNSERNLWPEAYLPRPGAGEKDEVENFLHRAVCRGELPLSEAVDEIRTDWVAVYRGMR